MLAEPELFFEEHQNDLICLDEIDLIMEKGNRISVFEFKASKTPKPGRGFWSLLEALEPEMAAVVSPVDQPYMYRQGVRVENLHSLGQMLLAD
jgi:hypothetical protein